MLMTALAGVSDAAALNDPTRPPNRSLSTTSAGITASPASRLELTSILVAPERRVAVINGRAVQVGERIGAYRVIAIQFDAVRVKNDNRMISLTLKHGDVKKSVVLPAKGE
jgi:MSHA biogenesis protein MshK